MKRRYLIIIFIILFIISIFVGTCIGNHFKEKQEDLLEQTNEVISKNINIDYIIKNENENNIIGKLIINKINLVAPVQEGTDKTTLRYSVGHFENSSLWSGNIALAAHNRGSLYNYFSKLNKLELGDEIIYKTVLGERRYEVCEINEIKSTDWSVIENTNDNRITLITCIKNNEDSRLCVIGKEI